MEGLTLGDLVNLGVGGAGLYLFARGLLLSKATVTEIITAIREQFSERLREWAERYGEMKADRDAWRDLALGNEERLEVAAPTVATAIGAPVPPEFTARQAKPSRRRIEEGYDAGDQAHRRRRGQ